MQAPRGGFVMWYLVVIAIPTIGLGFNVACVCGGVLEKEHSEVGPSLHGDLYRTR